MECLDDASLHLDFTFVSLVSGHPRPPVVTAPVYRGCPCRDPLGCLRCPGRMASGAERQSLWLRCVSGGGHVMWTFLIHAFYKHIFVFQGVTIFISDGIETKHGFLGTPGTLSNSALSFSDCVQGKFLISACRSARLSRVRSAIIWLNPWKSMHSKEIGSKHFPTDSHPSQHRMSVPRCLFLQARHALEAVNSFVPMLA